MDQKRIVENPTADLSAVDWVRRAKSLIPVINSAAGRIDSERRITPEVISAMHEAELFRMCLPRSLGGGEATPLMVVQTVEALASADASTAWCLGQALGCSRAAAYVEPEVAREIFGAPDAILAWGPPNGPIKAVAVEGGYRVTGKWKFVSGIHNANWLGPHCLVFEADGSPRLDAGGQKIRRTRFWPGVRPMDRSRRWPSKAATGSPASGNSSAASTMLPG